MELQLTLLSRWQYRYMDTVMAVIWGHSTQTWVAAASESPQKRVQPKFALFTSKTPIPAAIPPTMLACSFRIARICSKQPWGGEFSSEEPLDPWLMIDQGKASSPPPYSAGPLPACRGSCSSSSSSVEADLGSPSQTWSPQSRCSWWNHSTWAGKSRRSRQFSVHPSRKRMIFSSIWLHPLQVSSHTRCLRTSPGAHSPQQFFFLPPYLVPGAAFRFWLNI